MAREDGLGLVRSFSEGNVSGIRQFKGGQIIQATAAIANGNSGGLLVDGTASVVGVVTLFIPVGKTVLQLAQQRSPSLFLVLERHARSRVCQRSQLGQQTESQSVVRFASMTDGLRGVTGVRVDKLEPSSLAAGLSESKLNTGVENALFVTGIEILDDKNKEKHPRQSRLEQKVSTNTTGYNKGYIDACHLLLKGQTMTLLSNEPGVDWYSLQCGRRR